MLRPATPLTILFFIAFVLLLLATISTPIIKAIPLATVGDKVRLGVFGYCTATGCSGIQVGYSVDAQTLFGDPDEESEFSLPPGARSSLSSILIVHPVAALLTLICFIMSAVAHLHAPSHSPRYLIAILILSIPTLLATLLAFLVDILLFVPHLAWGGWIVLASTILILASGIVTCAMRRTLVSRKERKRRIAENNEMNGQNFYANQNPIPQGIRADSPPPLSSTAVGQSDKLPSFATFEKNSQDDDRIPLNTRTPSNKTLPSMPGSRSMVPSDEGSERYGAPPPLRGGPMGARGRGGYGGPKDEYGNALPPSTAFGPTPPMGMRRDRSEPPMRRQYSDEGMNGYGYGSRGGRGRGGYPPRGYGRGGPGRGGHGRGGAPQNWRPPPGYGNSYAQGRPGQYDGPGGPAGYGRSPSAPGYGRRQQSPGPPSAPGGYDRRSPGPPSAPGHGRGPPRGPVSDSGYDRGPARGPPSDPGYDGVARRGPSLDTGYERQAFYQDPASQRRPSPPSAPQMVHPVNVEMIGQAVEMDARHGSPSMSPGPPFAQQPQIRDSDSEVRGLVGMQQRQIHRESPMSMTSVYSGNEAYVPPRAAWKGNPAHDPANSIGMNDIPPASDPIELPVQNTPRQARSNTANSQTPSHHRKASENYYEDVDPRFADPPPPQPALDPRFNTQATQSSAAMPSALLAGRPVTELNGELVDPSSSYDELQDGQRSPASDHSNMTSISQRGVNPDWQPGEQQGRLGVPPRRPVQQHRDVALNFNPDPGMPVYTDGMGGRGGVPVDIPPPTQHGQAF